MAAVSTASGLPGPFVEVGAFSVGEWGVILQAIGRMTFGAPRRTTPHSGKRRDHMNRRRYL